MKSFNWNVILKLITRANNSDKVVWESNICKSCQCFRFFLPLVSANLSLLHINFLKKCHEDNQMSTLFPARAFFCLYQHYQEWTHRLSRSSKLIPTKGGGEYMYFKIIVFKTRMYRNNRGVCSWVSLGSCSQWNCSVTGPLCRTNNVFNLDKDPEWNSG